MQTCNGVSAKFGSYVQFVTRQGVVLSGVLNEVEGGWAGAVLIPASTVTEEALELTVTKLSTSGVSTLTLPSRLVDEPVSVEAVGAAVTFVQQRWGNIPTIGVGDKTNSYVVLLAASQPTTCLDGVVLISAASHQTNTLLSGQLIKNVLGHVVVLCEDTPTAVDVIDLDFQAVHGRVWKVKGAGDGLCEQTVEAVCSAVVGAAASTP